MNHHTIATSPERRSRGRAVLAGAAVAVLGSALLGGAGLLGPAAPAGSDGTTTVDTTVRDTTVRDTTVGDTTVRDTTVGDTTVGDTTTGDPALAASPGADLVAPLGVASASWQTEFVTGPGGAAPVTGQEVASEPHTPPWQDSPPPEPVGGMEPENPDLPNAWEIPDARPTGVDRLDSFGAPRMGMNYPRMVPVFDVMVCNTGAEDVEPLAGQDWMYYLDDTEPTGSIDIVVTGWEDSIAARDALRDDTMTFCVRDVAGDWEPLEWADHEGDEDYLLYQAVSAGREFGFAIVRQGDYLVGVTVSDTTDNVETAAEIASRTADNLEALDPDHGRD